MALNQSNQVQTPGKSRKYWTHLQSCFWNIIWGKKFPIDWENTEERQGIKIANALRGKCLSYNSRTNGIDSKYK